MSTKAEIEANIDAKLASGSGITATEHRAVLKDDLVSILNECYPDIVNDTHVTQNVFLPDAAGVEYDLKIVKQGRLVFLSGTITNNTGGPRTGLIEITDVASEYMMAAGATSYGVDSSPSAVCVISNGTGTRTLLQSTIDDSTSTTFSIVYPTES